jgi:hypothetical protein
VQRNRISDGPHRADAKVRIRKKPQGESPQIIRGVMSWQAQGQGR